jgi:hypothetical protein
MKLEINIWTHHLNQLIYSYLYFCEKNKLKIEIVCNKEVTKHGAVLNVNSQTIFFDYSDDPLFIDKPEKYNYYFKRSLLIDDEINNVLPLNFNLPLTYKSMLLIQKLKLNLLFDKPSRYEVVRAFDYYSFFTNSSHSVMDIRNYPKKIIDSGGKIIFNTRLWNPDNNADPGEKERRILQNDFRINACRIIKKNYKTASAGLFSDDFSKQQAPDLLLDNKLSNKNYYLNSLKNHNIGIADDGLKDTPGWKIGEYLLSGMAVVTTPLNVVLNNFIESKNYLKLTDRNSYQEIPDKIETLLKNKKYLEIAQNNLDWANEFLHPENYINRILSIVELKSKNSIDFN